MKLRGYQQRANDATIECFARVKSVLMVMATGLGKTVCFAHIAKTYLGKGRVMVFAHREELITQAAEKIEAITGIVPDIEMGKQCASSFFKSEIVVSSVQTLCAGMDGKGRMTHFDPFEFSLVIEDECHHGTADTYKRVTDYFHKNPDLRLLGVTATPDRTDKKALGQVFEESSFEYDIADGVDDGWLVYPRQISIFIKSLDFSECRTQLGDLHGKDLAAIMEFEETLHEIADATIKETGNETTLVFSASVAHGERLTEIINRHKPESARFVHGGTDKDIRRLMFKDYNEGKFQYLVNVLVATEGFDEPRIKFIVDGRPTKSRSLHTQKIGRGTRPSESIAHELNEDMKLHRVMMLFMEMA